MSRCKSAYEPLLENKVNFNTKTYEMKTFSLALKGVAKVLARSPTPKSFSITFIPPLAPSPSPQSCCLVLTKLSVNYCIIVWGTGEKGQRSYHPLL